MKNKVKKNIFKSILQINIIAAAVVFLSVISLNVFLAQMISSYEKMSDDLHNYADLSQYALTLINKERSKGNDEELRQLVAQVSEINQRTKAMFASTLEDNVYIRFSGAVSSFSYIERFLKNETSQKGVLSQIELGYISFLITTQKFSQYKEDAISMNMIILIGSLFSIFFGTMIYLKIKISSILSPLSEITDIARKLSISNNEVSLAKEYDYLEYEVLSSSMREMHKRIVYESKMNSHESATSLLSDFTQNIAHSINNPLAIIATSVKILQKIAIRKEDEFILNETESILEEIERITETTHKMKRLIRNNKDEETQLFKINNLFTLVNLLYFNKIFERGVKYKTNLDSNVSIHAKEGVLSQIIVSLFDNALKYTDPDNPIIEFNIDFEGTTVFLSIHDNGPVESSEEIEKKLSGAYEYSQLTLLSSKRSAIENGYKLYYKEYPRKEFILEIPNGVQNG